MPDAIYEKQDYSAQSRAAISAGSSAVSHDPGRAEQVLEPRRINAALVHWQGPAFILVSRETLFVRLGSGCREPYGSLDRDEQSESQMHPAPAISIALIPGLKPIGASKPIATAPRPVAAMCASILVGLNPK